VQLGPVPLKFGTVYPSEFDNTKDESAFDQELWKELQKLREAHFDETNPKEYCVKAWEFLRAGLVVTPQGAERLQPTIARMCEFPNEWPVNFRKHVEAHFGGSVSKLTVEWNQVINKVKCPVLVIHGTKDRNAPYGAGREWASMLSDARLVTLKNAAHQSWADEPHLVISAISDFIDGKWPISAQRIESKSEFKLTE